MFVRRIATALLLCVPVAHSASAQPAGTGQWHVMQDAVIYGLFNHQGGPRGGDELRLLDAVTVGKRLPGAPSDRRNVRRATTRRLPASA